MLLKAAVTGILRGLAAEKYIAIESGSVELVTCCQAAFQHFSLSRRPSWARIQRAADLNFETDHMGW